MNEQNDRNLRRMGRREQKERLQSPDSLFPQEESTPDLDLNSLPLPENNDAEALQMLSGLQGAVKAPKITPPEERYPPLRPVAEKPRQAKSPSAEASPIPAPKKQNNALFNFMTALILLSTVLFVAWFVQVWIDPQSFLNPLPPATPFIEVTATPNSGGGIVATPDDSGMIFVVITDTPSAASPSPYPFIVSEILYAPNSNDLGCNWWSIAGTVRDTAGTALNGFRIRVTGTDMNESVFSGASQAFGEGGFELPLVGAPREETFTVQLFSAQEAPLSEAISLQTRADCDKNVAIVNFQQNR